MRTRANVKREKEFQTNNRYNGASHKMSGDEEEHLREVFEEFRTSHISRDDVVRRTNSNSKKCGSFDVDDSITNHTVLLLQKIFLKQREEEESDFTKFYHFCFLACLRGKTEDVNAISVHDACELWAFLLSSTKKQLRKSSSLSVEEGSAPAKNATTDAMTRPSSVLAKGMLLPAWMNRTFSKFCKERVAHSSLSSSSSSNVVDEDTFLKTLDFARSYRKNSGRIHDWYALQKWPPLIDDFVSTLGRGNINTSSSPNDKEGNFDSENRMDEQLASSSIVADAVSRKGKGGRIGLKTVHPRGQKRKEQEANVDVLSSQLSSALQTKKRKTGGIRLDYFD